MNDETNGDEFNSQHSTKTVPFDQVLVLLLGHDKFRVAWDRKPSHVSVLVQLKSNVVHGLSMDYSVGCFTSSIRTSLHDGMHPVDQTDSLIIDVCNARL